VAQRAGGCPLSALHVLDRQRPDFDALAAMAASPLPLQLLPLLTEMLTVHLETLGCRWVDGQTETELCEQRVRVLAASNGSALFAAFLAGIQCFLFTLRETKRRRVQCRLTQPQCEQLCNAGALMAEQNGDVLAEVRSASLHFITETNRIPLVLFGMQYRTLGPFLAAMNRVLLSVMSPSRPSPPLAAAAPQHAVESH
jgi:hypothetical protein